MKILFFNFT